MHVLIPVASEKKAPLTSSSIFGVSHVWLNTVSVSTCLLLNVYTGLKRESFKCPSHTLYYYRDLVGYGFLCSLRQVVENKIVLLIYKLVRKPFGHDSFV